MRGTERGWTCWEGKACGWAEVGPPVIRSGGGGGGVMAWGEGFIANSIQLNALIIEKITLTSPQIY